MAEECKHREVQRATFVPPDGTESTVWICADCADGFVPARELRIVMAMRNALAAQLAAVTEALIAERAYHSNNTGANAARRKAAMEDLPKGWQKAMLLAHYTRYEYPALMTAEKLKEWADLHGETNG